MARYQGQVAVFRATVPLGVQDAGVQVRSRRRVVDKFTRKKWQELGHRAVASCAPTSSSSAACRSTSPARCRRPTQVTAFVADKDPNKRDKLVDQLLETPEYSYYFANKWADILRVKRRNQPNRAYGTFAFHDWIREAIADRQAVRRVRPRHPGRHRRRDEEPADGLVQGAARRPSSSWTTRPRCSSACAWPAPSATTTRTRSGARTTTGAWPRSSAASAARTCRCPGGVQNQQSASAGRSSPSPTGSVHQQADQPAGRRCKPLDGEPMDGRRRRRPAAEAGRLDGRRRRTRSSPGPWPTATGRTSSAAASSIRSTTCASPTRRPTPSCSTPWPRTWSTTSTA